MIPRTSSPSHGGKPRDLARAKVTFDASRDVPNIEVLAVPIFDDLDGLELSGAAGFLDCEVDGDYFRQRGFSGKSGETLWVRQCGAPSAGGVASADAGDRVGSSPDVLFVGVGKRGALSTEVLRRLSASVARSAKLVSSVGMELTEILAGEQLEPADAGRAVAEGARLGIYEPGTYKSERAPGRLERFVLVSQQAAEELLSGAKRGEVIADAVSLARDLVNEPAASMTPSALAHLASEIGSQEPAIEVRVWDEAKIEEEGLGGLLGVSRGSREPPRLIRLCYSPEQPVVSGDAGGERGAVGAVGAERDSAIAGSASDKACPTVVLVGKGITFDSGGLSIKSADGMSTMKTDMAGAAAVLATFSALAHLRPRVRVIGIVPATENMPGSGAMKPGDVVRARNGKTIEVLNTDAEGRLILADGLSLAVEEKPDMIIDIATLTGACVVALGPKIAGLMGNDDDLVARVRSAGVRAGEELWPLPLPQDYRAHIDSDLADMKNIGLPGGKAGALSAGLLLAEFVGNAPWVHLDIAGPARSGSDEGYLCKGGTGFGVRTFLELLASIG